MANANFEGSDDASFLNTVAGNPSSINEIERFGFSIFPNPMKDNGTININLSESSETRLDIVNILGEISFTKLLNLNSGNNSVNLNVGHLNNGIYFAHVTVDGETKTMKITINK